MKKVFVKYFGLILVALLMCSCVDVSKISASKFEVNKIEVSGFNSINVNLNANVENNTRRILFKEVELFLYVDGGKMAVLKLPSPLQLNRGSNEIDAGIKVIFSKNILSLLGEQDLLTKVINGEIEGYLKVKVGLINRKIIIHRTDLINYVPVNTIEQLFVR